MRDITNNLIPGSFDYLPEFIGADQLFFVRTVFGIFQAEDKGAAIGITAAAGIPVFISDRSETGILPLQRNQRRIDGLFFRTDQTDLHFTLLEGEYLRPEHCSISNTDQLELIVFHVVTGDNEEPRSIG